MLVAALLPAGKTMYTISLKQEDLKASGKLRSVYVYNYYDHNKNTCNLQKRHEDVAVDWSCGGENKDRLSSGIEIEPDTHLH